MADNIITDISQANNYQGSAVLGGAAAGGVVLETKPIENLANYTYYYNKSQYDQRQADVDAKIKELADITAYDPNTAIEKDKPAAIEAYKNLIDYTSNYARQQPKTAQDKLEQEWEYKKQIASTQKTIRSATERAIAYNKRKGDIMDNTAISQDQKDVLMKELNDDVAKTDINTPLPSENKFDQKIPEIKAEPLQTFEVASEHPNAFQQTKINIFDPTIALQHSQAESTGLQDLFTGEHKDFFKAAGNPYDIFQQSADALWSAVSSNKYKDDKGQIDFNAIQQSNPIAHDAISLIDQYNQWATQMQAQARAGVFTDRLGKNFKSVVPVPADHFFTIDKTKPLNGAQLIMLQKWQQSPKLITTDEQIQPTGYQKSLEVAGITQAGENARNAADIAARKYIANLPYEKAKLGTKAAVGADGQPLDFGNIIYGVNTRPQDGLNTIIKADGTKLEGVKFNNGVMVDKSGNVVNYSGDVKIPTGMMDNSIVTEFNKSAGITKTDAQGNVLSTPQTAKLVPKDGGFMVRMDKGEIRGIITEDGTVASADQFAHITQEAALKGVTKYKPPTKLGTQEQTQPPLTQYQKFMKGIK